MSVGSSLNEKWGTLGNFLDASDAIVFHVSFVLIIIILTDKNRHCVGLHFIIAKTVDKGQWKRDKPSEPLAPSWLHR